MLSLQLFGVETHPCVLSHVTVVHASEAWQVFAVYTQFPDVESQTSVVHALPSLHTFAICWHPVAVHLSLVHALLSSQAALLGAFTQFPFIGLHESTVQAMLSLQSLPAQRFAAGAHLF
jgi:hypothetical protein